VGIRAWTFTPVAGGVRVDTAESWSGETVEADRAGMQDASMGARGLAGAPRHGRPASITPDAM
jgi:hypothetical protein